MIDKIERLNFPLDVDFDINGIIEAINNTDTGEGTHLKPITIDFFVKNNLKGFFDIKFGTNFSININFKNIEHNPNFYYLKLRNVCKTQNNIMSLESWKRFFSFNNNMIVAPDGSLFITPHKEGNDEIFIVDTKCFKDTDEVLYLSYSIVLSFEINKKEYFFSIDPLVKISSKRTT